MALSPQGAVAALAGLRFPATFNPYADRCPEHDGPDAGGIRRSNLLATFEAAAGGVDALWIALEPGHRGARRTGLAMTDDAHLAVHAGRWRLAGIARATMTGPKTEQTAGIVWGALATVPHRVLLWNVFPLHCHLPGTPLSNRRHTRAEREACWDLRDRSLPAVLGETIWHIAALASLYSLDLGEVARRNMSKLDRRFGGGEPTPLPDEGRPDGEQLPRRFEISFVTVGPGRSRMYMDGRRLGDDLTDNAYREDGYRFHDVMHLALAAKLGWSPVLRKLMGRKRKSDPNLDEVEDGARAQIVEEALIKAIHAEGVRIAALAPATDLIGPPALFADRADMSFNFLKRLETFVSGLEVERSRYWEWEEAILVGFEMFQQLRRAGRGTVVADLRTRTLTFSENAFVDLAGGVAAIGSAACREPSGGVVLGFGPESFVPERRTGAIKACHRAILNSLALADAPEGELIIAGWRNDVVDARVSGLVQRAMWERGVIGFRASAIEREDVAEVTVLGMTDV